jgi:hypothetical protein
MSTAAPAPDKTREKTTYVILRETKSAGTVTGYAPITSGVTGNNAAHALKTWADSSKDATSGVYVAIPRRSFKPTKVTFSQQTVVKLD